MNILPGGPKKCSIPVGASSLSNAYPWFTELCMRFQIPNESSQVFGCMFHQGVDIHLCKGGTSHCYTDN